MATVGDPAAAAALAAALRREHPGVELVARRELPAVDWSTAWRAGLGPRAIGRLTIVPSWQEPAPAPGDAALILDPEMAFGSGEHGSTRAALLLLQRYLRPGMAVLDLGSGSGILTLAAARLGAGRAVGIESDSGAMPVALRNARRNGLEARVTFLEGDAGALAPLAGPADVLCANILREANIQLLPAVRDSLAPQGVAIFSGMEVSEASLFRQALQAAGFEMLEELADEGWWAVAARRP